MTSQEIFDTVVNHLRKQDSKSVALNEHGQPITMSSGYPSCLYRSVEGKKCAAGILITDEEYNTQMEGKSFRGLLTDDSVPASLIERYTPHSDLIDKLQMTHDCEEVGEWEDNFQTIAAQFYLTYTPVSP